MPATHMGVYLQHAWAPTFVTRNLFFMSRATHHPAKLPPTTRTRRWLRIASKMPSRLRILRANEALELKRFHEHCSLDDCVRRSVNVQTLERLGNPKLFTTRPRSKHLCSERKGTEGQKCFDEHASLENRVQRTAGVQTLERLGKPKLLTTRPGSRHLCSERKSTEGLKCLDEHASLETRVQRTAGVQTLERLGKPKLFMTRSESEGLKRLHEHASLDGNLKRTVEDQTLERLDKTKFLTVFSKGELLSMRKLGAKPASA